MIAKAELSRDAIVARALDIADVESLAAITIRRIAKEFGVTPMALYWHVQNKDELLAAMGDSFFDGLSAQTLGAGSWTERLRRLVTALTDALRAHPASAGLAGTRALQCDAGRELAEATLSLLRARGFSPTQAADIARTALQLAVMIVTERPGAEIDVPAEQRAASCDAKRVMLEALPAERFPALRECADGLTDCSDVDSYFRFSIDLFVGGVERLQRTLTRV